jgi:hypothetical protein
MAGGKSSWPTLGAERKPMQLHQQAAEHQSETVTLPVSGLWKSAAACSTQEGICSYAVCDVYKAAAVTAVAPFHSARHRQISLLVSCAVAVAAASERQSRH